MITRMLPWIAGGALAISALTAGVITLTLVLRLAGGVAAVTSFLNSKEGKQLQKQVVRGVFGLLKKKL